MGFFDRISQATDALASAGGLREVDRELLASGLVGSAVVQSIAPTAISFGSGANADPVVAFTLEVRLAAQAPYTVQLQQRVPHLMVASVQPGATVTVRVDATDQQRVAIDFAQAPTAQPAAASSDDALGKLERLAALHEQGALTDDEFSEEKRRLLGEI
jgi:hypothetical protein